MSLSDRYSRKYVKEWRFNRWEHRWEIVGCDGAAHLSIVPYELSGTTEYSAGLEMHYRRPAPYMKNRPPNHARCFLLEGPCWHVGTSLYAQEHFVPMFLAGDEDGIFFAMMQWCDRNLTPEDSEDERTGKPQGGGA